jgi:hypothetical protein
VLVVLTDATHVLLQHVRAYSDVARASNEYEVIIQSQAYKVYAILYTCSICVQCSMPVAYSHQLYTVVQCCLAMLCHANNTELQRDSSMALALTSKVARVHSHLYEHHLELISIAINCWCKV